MHWPRILIGVFSFTLLTALVRAQTAAPAEAPRAYVGSAACQRCHQSAYDTWRSTLHVQMTKPIAEARVLGRFTPGTRLEHGSRQYTMETHDGRYFITIATGTTGATDARSAEKFEVHYTLGARRFQGYLSKLADGRIYVLPVFWHNESKRWLDWTEITPVPDEPDHDLRQIWNVTCVNCHATNLVKNFDPATNTYASTWTEMGIGCEACHGPGREHIAATEAWERSPSTKPIDPTAAQLKVFAPKHATPRQMFDTCGYCHGNKNNMFFGFTPGDRYENFAVPFLISQPIPDNDPQGEFWPDGRPSRFNRPQALTVSGCFQQGQATCTNCHRMHGSPNDHALRLQVETANHRLTRQGDQLCLQCHDTGPGPAGGGHAGRAIDDVTAHTHHAADSQGSRCIGCHMSDVNWRLITRRRDHTFQPPVPELTARFGVPNACTTCHENKSPEWAADTMDRWYSNRDRRARIVKMADTMYRAGAGDGTVLPEIARLAVDRSHGALIRASAAEFAGQLIARSGGSGASGGSSGSGASGGSRGTRERVAPNVINALVGAAADPEAMVRIAAVRTLGLISDVRVPATLSAHLNDEARLVRVAAAEALMALGITQLDGANGTALVRAQDEWAESLRTFNDVAADQTTLGWLDAARGRGEQAANELRAAAALDPTDARPHVYLGVIAARAGRFDEALQEFRFAKRLSPSYQNLDRLIDEAAKRASKLR